MKRKYDGDFLPEGYVLCVGETKKGPDGTTLANCLSISMNDVRRINGLNRSISDIGPNATPEQRTYANLIRKEIEKITIPYATKGTYDIIYHGDIETGSIIDKDDPFKIVRKNNLFGC